MCYNVNSLYFNGSTQHVYDHLENSILIFCCYSYGFRLFTLVMTRNSSEEMCIWYFPENISFELDVIIHCRMVTVEKHSMYRIGFCYAYQLQYTYSYGYIYPLHQQSILILNVSAFYF